MQKTNIGSGKKKQNKTLVPASHRNSRKSKQEKHSEVSTCNRCTGISDREGLDKEKKKKHRTQAGLEVEKTPNSYNQMIIHGSAPKDGRTVC